MSQSPTGEASRRGERRSGSDHGSRRRSRQRRTRSPDHSDDKQSSPEDKGSPGSWNIDRGRSRTRRPSNTLSENNLRRRGYHSLFSVFGQVFHVEKRWKMIRDMGSGAYGVVITAADEITEQTVAIKLVTNIFAKVSIAKRALREITLLRHFAAHPNITGLIDVDAISKDFNEVYLFLEPMEADLHQIIQSGQTLTSEHVQYFLYQILCGMKYIHSACVVHRDLKPANLLVNANCELKICDFGLSRGFDAAPDEFATHMTEYVATRWYRAPEIMLAFRRYNTAIDVWSIGCILAELITGKPLFKGKDYVDQLNKILNVLGTPNEEVIESIRSDKAQAYVRSLPFREKVPFSKLMPNAEPPALDLVEKMLAFDPDKRMTVLEALEHPWLGTYHDENDEPECPVPYTKWKDIEKLETIEDFREALWKEIEDYRLEARSQNARSVDSHHARIPSIRREDTFSQTTVPDQGEPSSETPGIVVEDQASDADTLTAVEEAITAKEDDKALAADTVADKQEFPSVEPTAGSDTVHPTGDVNDGLRPGIHRRDSTRPPTPPNMTYDPVVQFARRSSILQSQYLQQQGGSASASPVRRAVSGLPAYEGGQEGFPPSAIVPTSERNSTTSLTGAPPVASGQVGSIPFPTTGGGSYIFPARSRTGSTMSGEYAQTWGPRKLLRTLSTVSIHESVEGITGGLAAMGPMGQAIIERQETTADAPASELPLDFESFREEREEHTATAGTPASEKLKRSSVISPSGSKKSARSDGGKGSAPSSAAEGKDSGSSSGTGTPAKRRERRFIIF